MFPPPDSFCSPAESGATLCNKADKCDEKERAVDHPAPRDAALDRRRCLWKALEEVWKSIKKNSQAWQSELRMAFLQSNITNLLQDILLSREFLSFSVRFVDHDLQNILSAVWDVHYKEDEIFQELGHKPGERMYGYGTKHVYYNWDIQM